MKNFMHNVKKHIIEATIMVVLLPMYPFIWVTLGGLYLIIKLEMARFYKDTYTIEECYEFDEVYETYKSAMEGFIITQPHEYLLYGVLVGVVGLIKVTSKEMWKHSGWNDDN